MHVVALEDGQALDLGVVVLDPVGELGADGPHVVPHLLEERQVVDHDAPVLRVELLAQDPDRQLGLPVEQARGVGPLGLGLNDVPLLQQGRDVTLELLGRDALGGRPHDHAVPGGLHLVDDAAQPAPLVVTQALGDAEGARVGHQDGEAPGQRHLLGQAGTLGPDGVLGDLAQDGLAGLEDVLDPGLLGGPALDVLPVVAHVAPVEDGVLGDADVDEGGLHAGQDVLHPAPVDVAVDLVGVVGRPGDVVLHQRAPLEHGDLGHVGLDVDADQVAAHLLRLAVPAGATPAAGTLAVAVAVAFGRFGLLHIAASLSFGRGRLGPLERHHGGRRLGRRGCGDGRCRPGVPDLRLRPGRGPRPVGRASAAAAPRLLRGVTLRALADFRLGHEGKPSSRAVSRRHRSRARSQGAARTERHRVRSIDAFDRPVRAPRGCPGPLPGRLGGHHAGAWPIPPEDDRWGWSGTVPGWPGGCRPRFDDPSAPA